MVSLFAAELMVWQLQLPQMRALMDPQSKQSTAGPPESQKTIQDTTRNGTTDRGDHPKQTKKNELLGMGAQNSDEATKIITQHHTAPQAP